jgi:hypothetical protein
LLRGVRVLLQHHLSLLQYLAVKIKILILSVRKLLVQPLIRKAHLTKMTEKTMESLLRRMQISQRIRETRIPIRPQVPLKMALVALDHQPQEDLLVALVVALLQALATVVQVADPPLAVGRLLNPL